MSRPLTTLAVQNREIIALIACCKAPSSIAKFAADLDRDPANFRKTLRLLEEEGWIAGQPPGSTHCFLVTEDGQHGLLAMDFASGAANLAPPVLTHADLQADPDQPRRDFESDEARKFLASLAESIAERGLKQPILIRFDAQGQALVTAGERRWRAIGQLIAAGDPRWPADRAIPHLLENETDAAEILATQVVENVQRAGLHPLEEAAAFKRLKEDHAWGVGQISKAIGRSRRFVEQRLDLLNLSPGMQDKMRLPKDHDDHLTVPRARELLAHLRQIAAGANEQRDIEEIAPADVSAEEIEAARKVKLDPRAMLALGEIAAAIAAKPSTRFPHSPAPVVDVDRKGALLSERLAKLTVEKMATLVIDAEEEDRPAGVRMEPLGHLRLRLDQVHPADNPRAVFHLRREAGLSADQARHLTSAGRWSTNFLNVEPAKASAEAQPAANAARASADELLALTEIRARCERRQHTLYGMARVFHPMPEAFERKFYPRWISTMAEYTGDGRRYYVRLTSEGEELLRDLGLWPDDFTADAALRRARDARDAWIPRALALGEYATEWLSFRGMAGKTADPVQDSETASAPEVEDQEDPPLAQAEFFSAEVQEHALAAERQKNGGRWIVRAKLSGSTTIEGETWPADPAEILATDWTGHPRAEIRLSASDRGRWHVCLRTIQGGPNYSGSGDAYGVYTSDPVFRTRADALAHAAARIVKQLGEWGKKRNLRNWLADLVAEPAQPPPADAGELSIPEISILRQVDHAQSANGGEPVTVGAYWLDLDAVDLSKRAPAGLIEFRAEPGERWKVSITAAGRAELERLGPSETFEQLMREHEEFGEGYSCAWLNPSPDDGEGGLWAEDHGPEAEPAPEPEDDTHGHTLATVREHLTAGAPNFAELLKLVGLPGKFSVSDEGVLSAGSNPTDIAVDPWRDGPDDLAQARAELIAYALNVLAGHANTFDPSPKQVRDAFLEGIIFGVGAQDGSIEGEELTDPEAWADVWIDSRARKAFATTAEPLPEQRSEPLLAINVGTVMHKGTDATAYRILERVEDRRRQYGAQLEPVFRAQTIRNGKDYGSPVVIGLGDLIGFVPAKAAA